MEISSADIMFGALQECQGKLVENASSEGLLLTFVIILLILFYGTFILCLYLERYKKFVKADEKLEKQFKEYRRKVD